MPPVNENLWNRAAAAAALVRSPFLPDASSRWIGRAAAELDWLRHGERHVDVATLAAGLRADKLTVICADALEFDFRALRGSGAKLRLAGNLPYNVSTPLLFRLIEQIDAIADMHFMLQKEVVARMAARPGTRDYGRLTVMLAPHVRVRPLFDIGTGAFSPPPRVQSTYFALEPLSEPPFALGDRTAFARVVAAAFSQRRKTLRNSLRALVDATAIESAGIDPGARPETLAPAEFAALAARSRS